MTLGYINPIKLKKLRLMSTRPEAAQAGAASTGTYSE
jgi:hypothetical protein